MLKRLMRYGSVPGEILGYLGNIEELCVGWKTVCPATKEVKLVPLELCSIVSVSIWKIRS